MSKIYKYLHNATLYCAENNDLERFEGIYGILREYNDVEDSTFGALYQIYGPNKAMEIKNNSAAPFI
jgi:hypothetical protein